jgi:hypothetical protein
MPKKVLKKDTLKIDTVPLPEKVVKGRINLVGGKLVLTVAGAKKAIPAGALFPETELKKLAGKDVAVAFSEDYPKNIVAIGTWPTPEVPRTFRKRWWICYIPVPDLIGQVSIEVQNTLVHEMIAKGVLSKKLGQEIVETIPR